MMRSLISALLSLGVCAACPVFADNPVTDPTASASAAVPESAAPPATAAAPAKTATEKQAEAEAVRAKELRAAGYKPQTQNGETLWCRKEAETGTTFQKKTCASAEALEQSVKESQDFASRMQRQSVTTMKGN